jgi:pyridoxine kinase
MKKIALINDLSGFGRCSLTAAIPVISALGVQACPLPTAILSAQTGFENYYYDDYTDHMNRITDKWAMMGETFDGIYSGYLGSDAQVENVLYFLDKFHGIKFHGIKFHEKNTVYLCDPIMGDNGKQFPIFTPRLLDSMKTLCLNADVITPNLTELCLICGVDFNTLTSFSGYADYENRIADIARGFLQKSKRGQTVIVTGIISNDKGYPYIGNLVVSSDDDYYVKTPYTGKSFSGTGDLFASVVVGCIVNGFPVNRAVDKAVEFLQPAIEEASKDTNHDRNHGVYFEKYLGLLMR